MPQIPHERSKVESGSMRSAMQWSIALPTGVIFAICFANGVLEPTLQLHLEGAPLYASEDQIGVVFSIGPFVYTVMAPLMGMLDDGILKANRGQGLMCGGLLCVAASMLLIGPLPLPGLHLAWPAVFSAMALLGVGYAMCFAPTMKQLNKGLAAHVDASELNTVASAVCGFALQSGSALGSTSGGALADVFGIPLACSIIGFLLLPMMAIFPVAHFRRSRADCATGVDCIISADNPLIADTDS